MISPAFGVRNWNVTETVPVTFDRNRIYAESVKIYSFGTENETKTKIRLVFTTNLTSVEPMMQSLHIAVIYRVQGEVLKFALMIV